MSAPLRKSRSPSRSCAYGWPVVPKVKLFDQHWAVCFNAIDIDPRWREPSATGEYVATAWIPPNLLNEGRLPARRGRCDDRVAKSDSAHSYASGSGVHRLRSGRGRLGARKLPGAVEWAWSAAAPLVVRGAVAKPPVRIVGIVLVRNEDVSSSARGRNLSSSAIASTGRSRLRPDMGRPPGVRPAPRPRRCATEPSCRRVARADRAVCGRRHRGVRGRRRRAL